MAHGKLGGYGYGYGKYGYGYGYGKNGYGYTSKEPAMTPAALPVATNGNGNGHHVNEALATAIKNDRKTPVAAKKPSARARAKAQTKSNDVQADN
jgi:hypothetical protein